MCQHYTNPLSVSVHRQAPELELPRCFNFLLPRAAITCRAVLQEGLSRLAGDQAAPSAALPS